MNTFFSFFEDGFSFSLNSKEHIIFWKEIQQINAYKLDILIVDCIFIDVFCENEMTYTFHEELEAWNEFLANLETQFPEIKKSWKWDIVQPPFEANKTTIYTRI